jgi:hypothetical protein
MTYIEEGRSSPSKEEVNHVIAIEATVNDPTVPVIQDLNDQIAALKATINYYEKKLHEIYTIVQR